MRTRQTRSVETRAVAAVMPPLLALLALMASGCGGGAAEPAAQLVTGVRDSAGVRIVELADPWAASIPEWEVGAGPSVVIGAVAGPPQYELFGALAAVVLSSGEIAVANSGTSEVRLYDPEGGHLRSFGRGGDGPGEFRGMSWIGVGAGDTIVVYDLFLRRATWLPSDGGGARTLALDPVGRGGFPEPIGLSGTGLVMRTGFDRQFGRGERRDTVQLYLYDDAGAVADSLGSYPGRERFFYAAPDGSFSAQFTPIYGRDGYAHVRSGRLAVGSSDVFEIDVFDDARLTLRIRAADRPRPVVQADVERVRQARRSALQGMIRERALPAIDELPARETLPAFEGLQVDQERWIWIRYASRHSGEAQGWLVLDPDGVPAARVEVPHDLEVYEIGADYLLGRQRIENGVEQIVMYSLDRRG